MILYLAPNGNDDWSGTLDAPNADGTDGPLATVAGVRARASREGDTGPDGGQEETVCFARTGRYPFTDYLISDRERITYRPYPGETPVYDGGGTAAVFRVFGESGGSKVTT